jgi:Flp pilus assembly protein TadG
MCPWLLLLFAGLIDVGYYNYAAISTQSAASVAALHTSSDAQLASDSAGACTHALKELAALPEMGGVTGCSDFPVKVTAVATPDPCATGQPCESAVTVSFRTVPLFRIPGLMDRLNISRTATMRVQPDL